MPPHPTEEIFAVLFLGLSWLPASASGPEINMAESLFVYVFLYACVHLHVHHDVTHFFHPLKFFLIVGNSAKREKNTRKFASLVKFVIFFIDEVC